MPTPIQMHKLMIRLLINKRYLFPRIFMGFLFILGVYRISLNVPTGSNMILDDRARSKSLRSCKFPQLFVDDPLIKKYFVEEKPLKCNKEKNWVYIDNGRFYIDTGAVKKHGNITCDFLQIERIDDNHYSETRHENVKNDTPLLSEMSRVRCTGEDGENYENLHLGVRIPETDLANQPSPAENPKNTSDGGLKMNVLIYILDSVSRMHFIRKLPKFYRFLNDELKGFIFEGFNIVGDSTTAALIPMTTGYFQTELHEARKRHANATYLDDWPLIFKEYNAKNYITTYLEEQAWVGAFHLRLKGFENPPLTHYMRPLLIAYENQKRRQLPYCLGDTPESIAWLEYFRQLQVVHKPRNNRHFSLIHISEATHDLYNKVQILDEHLKERFGQLLKDGYFDDTMVIVMSDHGHRHVTTRATQSGKWEERLPFLFIRPPTGFCDQYPEICENMRANGDALVTAFDIHITLQDILNFRPENFQGPSSQGQLSERGISLFKKIPYERTCAHAAITSHFCSCLEWQEIEDPNHDPLVLGAAQHVVDIFNEKTTHDLPGACANLTVDKILSARHLQPNEKLLAFKESFDYDQLFPDLSDNSSIAAIIYQVHFMTLPGPGAWEVSVTYFTQLHKYAMSMDSVSRVNMYGEQARCVLEEFPHLRTFCYCLYDKAPGVHKET